MTQSSIPLNRPLWQGFTHLRKLLPTSGFTLFLWILWIVPSLALELRIAIQEGADQVIVGTSNPGVVRNQQGQQIARMPEGRSLTVATEGYQLKAGNIQARSFWVEPSEGGFVYIGDRWYRGRVLVISDNSGVTAVNYVDLEDYLYSVVGSEMPTSWPQEALKAQAVAARSYVLYHRQRARHPHYDVGGTTAWQVYKGIEQEAYSTQTAVESTRNQVLIHNGQIIESVFHSSSGGHTENVEDVWSRPIPYLRGVQDYDFGAPVFEWTQSFSIDELSLLMPEVGRIFSATPQRMSPRGRVQEILLEGDRGSLVMTGNDLRTALSLRSTLFSVAIYGNTVQINGRGYGHGIGMSQWGAHNMAQQGYTYQQILGHYYQGAQLATIQVQ